MTSTKRKAISRERVHLTRRVRQEAEAAMNAESVAATIVHVTLANCYAQRLQALRNSQTASS